MSGTYLIDQSTALNLTHNHSMEKSINNTLQRSSVAIGRALSLTTFFPNHNRTPSSSSEAETIVSTLSDSSPMSTSSYFGSWPSSSAEPSPRHERSLDPFAIQSSMRAIKIPRSVSSTSLALQSEYEIDQLEGCGLSLFEPRPHQVFSGSRSARDYLVMDGIMQVIKSGK